MRTIDNFIKVLFCAAVVALLASCGDEEPFADGAEKPSEELSQILKSLNDSDNPYDVKLNEAPDDNCQRIRINNIGPLRKVFNDSNHVQLEAAKAIGITPIKVPEEILNTNKMLVEVKSCKEYFLDELTHSFPFLVPEASQLLTDIGKAFNDSLAARGGGAYRLKVTSVLRTPATVKRLRRVNRNATEESTHAYGTTFDISYSKFICDDPSAPRRTFEDLKNLLAEVLNDMRNQGRCYVKFEYKQSCFHITVRPKE